MNGPVKRQAPELPKATGIPVLQGREHVNGPPIAAEIAGVDLDDLDGMGMV